MKISLDAEMKQKLGISESAIEQFCQRNHVQRLGVFGSVLREDFNPAKSDVDVLIEFEKGFKIGLIAFVGVELELADILHRKVDLASWKGIQESQNTLRKKTILESAKVIYDAAG